MRFLLLGLCCFELAVPAEGTAGVSKNSQSQLIVIQKNNSLRSIEELLKNSSRDNDLNDLLVRIQNTKELLMGMVRKKKLTKTRLKNEIDKFNNNMKDILARYKKFVDTVVTDCDDSNNNVSNEHTTVKVIKGHSIVTLDSRKRVRFNPGHTAIQDIIDPLIEPLTEENIQEFIESDSKAEFDSLLGRKDIPDSDSFSHYVSTSASAKRAIDDIEAQKEPTR